MAKMGFGITLEGLSPAKLNFRNSESILLLLMCAFKSFHECSRELVSCSFTLKILLWTSNLSFHSFFQNIDLNVIKSLQCKTALNCSLNTANCAIFSRTRNVPFFFLSCIWRSLDFSSSSIYWSRSFWTRHRVGSPCCHVCTVITVKEKNNNIVWKS